MMLKRALFFISVIVLLVSTATAQHKKPLIVIKPVGYNGYAGRKLHEMYERGATYQWALELQKALKKHRLKVFIPFDAAAQEIDIVNTINQRQPDLVVQLHLYPSTRIQPTVHIFHLLLNPLVDTAPCNQKMCQFTPVRQVHRPFVTQSAWCGRTVYEMLHAAEKGQFLTTQVRGIPCKELVGIQAPAVVVETGICQDNRWKNLVDPLAQALAACVQQTVSMPVTDDIRGKS
jgi:hypothetical protein